MRQLMIIMTFLILICGRMEVKAEDYTYQTLVPVGTETIEIETTTKKEMVVKKYVPEEEVKKEKEESEEDYNPFEHFKKFMKYIVLPIVPFWLFFKVIF